MEILVQWDKEWEMSAAEVLAEAEAQWQIGSKVQVAEAEAQWAQDSKEEYTQEITELDHQDTLEAKGMALEHLVEELE
jgi:hypothetical protein